MHRIKLRFVGVELYFDNLEKAKEFYRQTLGLDISDGQVGHHAKFDAGAGFIAWSARGLNRTPRRTGRSILRDATPERGCARNR